MKKTNQRGITLIALIITIIVMLILVGVTINIALNGGLFQKAKSAADGTQKQAEKEELISVMIGAYNSTGKFAISNVGDLPNGAKWCNEGTKVWSKDLNVTPTGNGDWIITRNNNKFYIDNNGSVLDEEPKNLWRKRGLTTSYVEFYKEGETKGVYHSSNVPGIGYFTIWLTDDGKLYATSGGLDSNAIDTAIKAQKEGLEGLKVSVTEDTFTNHTHSMSFTFEEDGLHIIQGNNDILLTLVTDSNEASTIIQSENIVYKGVDDL